MRNWLLLVAVFGASLVGLLSLGQSPAPSSNLQSTGQAEQKVEDADVVLRISVNLVQVDAVVTDAKGRQVTDLKPEDFTILQDNRPQRITHFSYISVAGQRAPAAAPPTRPATLADKLAPPPPPTKLRPEQIRRTVALVVDDLGLSWESSVQVRAALKKFLDTQMQPGDLVAIIRTGAGMGALQQFSSDKRQLYAAVERVRYNLMGRAGISAFAPMESNASAGEGEQPQMMGETPEELRERVFSVGMLGAVNFIVRGLKTLPGRKSIVLFSDNLRILNRQGFNYEVIESLRSLTDQANRAGVVIYGVDPRGLPTLSLTAADNVSGMSAERVMAQLQQRHDDHFDSQVGIRYLAEQTGGFYITNNNDINWGLDRVLEDQDGYYLIGYTPDRSTFDEKTGRRLFHRIRVRVNRPGLRVRSRTGFYGISDEGSRPVYRTREEQMLASITSPFGSGNVRLRLTPVFGYDPKRGSFVRTMLHIDGGDLTFSPDTSLGPDTGWYKTVLDLLVMTFGDNGAITDQSSTTYTIRARGKEYELARQNGFFYTVAHAVKKPGAYQLRVAVRDTATEKVGSASQFIEVPDVKKGKLVLTGLMVRSLPPGALRALPPAPAPGAAGATKSGVAAQPGPAAKPGVPAAPAAGATAAAVPAEGQTVEADPLGNPFVRVFQAGRSILYACQVLNAHLDNSRKPQLESQLRLFRDGKQLYAGKPMRVDTSTMALVQRVVAGGELRLARSMDPGDYTMQVIVTDKLAKEKFNTATQWIDFQVAR
jgi:VWFA-related protein